MSVFLHPCVPGPVCVPINLSDYGVCTHGSGCTCLMLMPQVTQHIATCQPLAGALDNGRVILCDMMADPWVSAGGPCGRGA